MKRFPKVSVLTLRILAINMAAVLLLGFGILYIVQYQDQLVKSELSAMKAEANLFAGALSESATQLRLPGFSPPTQSYSNRLLLPNMTRRMVRRFSEAKKIHVRVYNSSGETLADSEQASLDNFFEEPIHDNAVKQKTTTGKTLDDKLNALLDQLLKIIPKRLNLQKNPDIGAMNALSFPDARVALQGRRSASAWTHPATGELYLSAAAPILKSRSVIGAVYLTKPASNIELQIRDLQLDILKLFSFIFAVTIVLSLYLSSNIARPLKKLAFSARQIRNNKSRDIEIPDFGKRKDEIGQLSLALRDMTNSLWDRMDAIESFAADVSHELKNPLTSLRSAVETARRLDDKKSVEKLMDIILHDVQRLDRLITDISRASRLDAELSKDSLEPIDLYAFLSRLRDIYSLAETARSQRFVFQIEPAIRHAVMGNETRLMQVLDNVISNALSFSPEAGVITITVIAKQNDVIRILVEDQGTGIPENKLKSIFDRFYTERPEGESYGEHSGLGLSIAKQIMLAHGGDIRAENIIADGKVNGARFIIELPEANA